MLSGTAHSLLLGLPWHYKYIFDHIHYNNHIFNKNALNVQCIMNVEFNIILQNTEKLMACLVTFFVFRFHFLLLDIERKYMGEGEMKKGGGRTNKKNLEKLISEIIPFD